MSVINQKEYLKKYLGIGKGPKNKKKKKKSKQIPGQQGKGLKIVDDDIDANLNDEIQVDLAGDNEDAPQIVSVIDERPPSLRIDEKTQHKLWKPLGAPEESNLDKNIAFEGSFKVEKSSFKNPGKYDKVLKKDNFDGRPVGQNYAKQHIKMEIFDKNDTSPPRKTSRVIVKFQSPGRNREGSSDDSSPPRRRKDKSGKDISPPRRQPDKEILLSRQIKREKSEDNSPSRRSKQSEIDKSPPRKIRREKSEDISPPRKTRSIKVGSSPPRKRRGKPEDSSPPRRSKQSEIDMSPPRKIKREKSEDISPLRKSRNSIITDSSPPRRRRNKSEDHSPPRRSRRSENDSSPPRKIKREGSEHMSPSRKSWPNEINTSDSRRTNRKKSPTRQRKSRWADLEEKSNKMQKTLDGKKAGLQNATDLAEETLALKKREDVLFKNLSAEVSGANAATVVRSKKKEVDWEEEEKRRKKEEENKEKYERWGKGLKQVEDVNEKIKSDLHEMSKPLARYADDEDLEKYLRDQERDGDPMLGYIRQKKKKKDIDEGKPIKQQYQGDAPPNRFGIWPGYRWDGVDRSNGYEKQWFQVQNSKTASIEETYKWSTEDM